MRIVTTALAVLMALSILFAIPVAANTPPPSPPHYFYGTLKIDNVDAPIGTIVEAKVTGVLNDLSNPIITTEVGRYSDQEPPFTYGLLVQGTIAEGATIEFHVNGVKANETAEWHSGQLTALNLTAGTVPPLVSDPPTLFTSGTIGVTSNSAVLFGTVTSLGTAAAVDVSFEYGVTTSYGSATPVQTLSTAISFNASISGLLPNTLYHYRAKAVAGSTVVFGSDQTFRTTATGGGGSDSSGGVTDGGGIAGGVTFLPVTNSVSFVGLAADKELKVDSSGKAQNDCNLTDPEKKLTVNISSGTNLKTTTGEALQSVFLTTPVGVPPVPTKSVALLVKDLGPNGATFSPPISLVFSYDVSSLPAGASEDGLYLVFWDGSQWVKLTSTVDKQAKTVSAKVSHFTLFALLATVIAPPSVTIVSPVEGATLAAGNIQVTVQANNFELVAPGGLNVVGQGHLHYYLDVIIPTTPGEPAVTAVGTYQATVQPTVTWANVAPGAHILGVQLVNNDHTPLTPPVIAQIMVRVTDTQLITILPPPSSVTAPLESTTPPESTVSPPSSEITGPVPTPTAIPESTNWGLILAVIVVAGILILAILVLVP